MRLEAIATLALLSAMLGLAVSSADAAEVTIERSPQGAVVKIDGKLFTEYVTCSVAKPILYPIIGPTGKPVTRSYPMEDVAGEKKDHVHHRSMWFTHGLVNGVDFWGEAKQKSGTTNHREFVKIESSPKPTIVTRNDWIGPDGKKFLEDERTLHFGANDNERWIDFDIVLRASEGPVTFGDTKEGSFGLRMVESIRVDAHKGGQIVDSEGRKDAAAWGKRAAWVDYHGPVDDELVGVAIFNHPKSFRYPTYWHVRTYGLFAANPFGMRDFTEDKSADGTCTLAKGESITLRYRVFLHRGDEMSGNVAEAFAVYAGHD